MSVFEMDRNPCNPPNPSQMEDPCRPNPNYTQPAAARSNPCDIQCAKRNQFMPQQQQMPLGNYNSMPYGNTPFVGGGGGGYCYNGGGNAGNFCQTRPQAPGNMYGGGNMYGSPCQVPSAPPPPQNNMPMCPPEYPEPRDPNNTGPMALVNLTQNTAGLGLQTCKTAAPPSKAADTSCWNFGSMARDPLKPQAGPEPDIGGSVEEKARQKAELKIKMLLRDVIAPEFNRKQQEIEANEKANEQLFGNYRAANAFKDGCMNASVFVRKPIRNYEGCEEELTEKLRRLNPCGKEAPPCGNSKDKKQNLLDSISESQQYLDSYKKALERSNMSCKANDATDDVSHLQIVQQWISDGMFSDDELNCIISKAQAATQIKCK